MTRTEALAAALHRIHPGPRPWPGGLTDDEMADHILAALDGYELVPVGLVDAARRVAEEFMTTDESDDEYLSPDFAPAMQALIDALPEETDHE